MKFLAFILCFLPYALAWWKHTTIYEVYVASFKDSNGDGYGDLNGITQKLDHFKDLGIETIYITPFFQSPMLDMGYDVSNYTVINPLFGTMKDFHRLMARVKKRGLKVIGDLVINHSSDEHPWFKKSIDRIDPYTDFYIWVDPKGYTANKKPIPPNNWLTIFEGSAWQWNDKRKQFYLHQFAVKQPDLNLRNQHLKQEIKKIVKFWFDKGISGFRLDAPKHYIEDEQLRNEPLKNPKQKQPKKYSDLIHKYTVDLWESYEFIHEIRQFVDRYNARHGHQNERILIAEVYTDLNHTLAYYDKKNYNITHFPFDFDFVTLYNAVPAKIYDEKITRWLQRMPPGATPNWMSENHDQPRMGNKLGEQYKDIVTITIMTLPGTVCIYYGQEIGMNNYILRSDQRRDPNNDGYSNVTRDGERLPMQWDNSLNAGFTSNYRPWLPVNPDYWMVNVKTAKADKNSRYNMFKTLSYIRKTDALVRGHFNPYIISEWVYSYVRSCEMCDMYLIILNLGTETEFFNLPDIIPNLPRYLKVVTASKNAGYKTEDSIRLVAKTRHIFFMRPSSAVVLTSKQNITSTIHQSDDDSNL